MFFGKLIVSLFFLTCSVAFAILARLAFKDAKEDSKSAMYKDDVFLDVVKGILLCFVALLLFLASVSA